MGSGDVGEADDIGGSDDDTVIDDVVLHCTF